MKRPPFALFSIACQLLAFSPAARADELAKHDVVWDSPSLNSHGSMPIGNGDVGINAWVEPSGDLVYYISKTDAWDENARLCKIGRVRVKFDPSLPVSAGFRQELKLRDGVIAITAGNSRLELRVDAHSPVVRMDATLETPSTCQATVELWRLRERPFGPDDDGHSSTGLSGHPSKPTVLPDVVVPSEHAQVVWYHRNTRSLYQLTLQNQHLDSLRDRFPDPLLNHTFGARLDGDGFFKYGPLCLKSTQPSKQHSLSATVQAARTDTPESWLAALQQMRPDPDRGAHVKWWQDFWERSRVFLPGNHTLTRGYVLQRFMSACSGRGNSPIKYNGSIFTVEAKPGANPETPDGDPDWRKWGGNYWFQNTRLSYWPMLASGDFELMDPWFRMYQDALPLSKARIESYYKFSNAAQFPETMYFWGLPNNFDYGWSNQAPEPANPFIRRYWNSSLELISVMLDRYDYTRDEGFARNTLRPLAEPLISFLAQYWTGRDEHGKIHFEPAQALETWHEAINPLPEIAGLRFLLPRLLALPESITNPDMRDRWKQMLDSLPPVPVGEVDGKPLLRPAETFSNKNNMENVELYAVFPYRLFGVGRPGLDMARATYQVRGYRHNVGWCQDSIQAACLGLADEAGRLVQQRASMTDPDFRFPAMWGPNFDWTPDQCHGSNILTTFHSMLLQPVGDKLYLLPAWPKDWDCEFKLHAPANTTVEGVYRGGKLVSLRVTPESRRQDVVLKE